ncbi:hypothetical protein HYU11_04785 [Candidatus Woesearchaeota archaeon]|nr:hypothetical protein [Candidatus Woesearchaeota archaeon]
MANSGYFSIFFGRFFVTGNNVQISPPVLQVPLINSIMIGRADSEKEVGLTEIVKGSVYTPNYNGEKIIVPHVQGNLPISRSHGELVRRPDGTVDYVHLSQSGSKTVIWSPNNGIEDVIDQIGKVVKLKISEGSSSYLLVGGAISAINGSLARLFVKPSYYIQIKA